MNFPCSTTALVCLYQVLFPYCVEEQKVPVPGWTAKAHWHANQIRCLKRYGYSRRLAWNAGTKEYLCLPDNPVSQEPAQPYYSIHFSLDLELSKLLMKAGKAQ